MSQTVVLSDLIVKIDIASVVALVNEAIGDEATKAYDQYLDCRSKAKACAIAAREYGSSADYLEKKVEDNLKDVLLDENIKKQLTVHYALGDEQEAVYDVVREKVAEAIVAADQPTFLKYAEERGNQQMLPYLREMQAEARKQAVAYYNDGDAILKAAGLESIITKRNAVRESK